MKISIKKPLVKTLKISGIVLGSIILLMFLLPYLFPQTVTSKIKGWINGNINGNISFSGTSLSFFKKFPALTLTLYDVNLQGSAPFQKDTLIAAKELSLGIDLSSLFKSKINIDKIFLNRAFINIQVDSAGKANYSIYKGAQQSTTASSDTSGASLGIDQILIEDSHLVYNDLSIPTKINARNFNYKGSGDLSKDVFTLHSHTDIGSIDFYYDNQPYVLSKKVNADLVTNINTKSLAFEFQKNDLKINQLPVQFKGRFAFIKDGYDMDFKIDSHETNLNDIFTAMPAAYLKMLDKTDVKGIGDIKIALTGKYIAKDNIKPDFSMNLMVRNGYVANKATPSPVRNLYLNMETRLPHLNMDSLYVNVDSIYFNIDKDYFSSVIRVKGVKSPYVYAKVNTEIDMDKWTRAFGIKAFDVRGRYSMHLLSEGRYTTGIIRKGLRKKVDTVITSVPKFSMQSSFKNGYFKYASLPEAVSNISFNMKADCPDNNYKHISMSIDNLYATALTNYIKGYFKLSNADTFPIDAKIETKFHLADLKKFYPADSLFDVKGNLDANMQIKGNYIAAQKKFPVMVANIIMKDGSVKTKYYPHPIQNIQVNTTIINRTGTLNGMKVFIKPISFNFEGEPFFLKASLNNFADVEYNINSQGTINIGRIYKVFAIKGYNVDGAVTANVSLKGKQSDAVAGHYDKLSNSGTLKVKNISLTTEMFPKPFYITKGVFSFNQDKMNFDAFTAKYGNSTLVLNGALSNVINYAIKPGSVLKGDFNLSSDLITVDDFMVFAGTPDAPKPKSAPSGVIMVPKNLDLNFTAAVKKIKYQTLTLTDAKGQMAINNGNIDMKSTGFTIIGTPVTMDATYTNTSARMAFFNYHINAKDFDIKKAYDHIKLFHDMVTTAAYAQGLVSLDYQISGKLNSNMQPVYPSLKGGGTLSAKKIQLHGYKLFGAMGKAASKDSVNNNADVSQVNIKSTIANNVITIERTKLRMAGFRARFEGKVNFDKQMDIKFRLGLPPLGIIGIPMNITGTQDNPKVRLGNGKKEGTVQETTDDSGE